MSKATSFPGSLILPPRASEVTRPNQGLSSLALGSEMRDPGNEVASKARPVVVFPSSYTNTIFNQSARVFS